MAPDADEAQAQPAAEAPADEEKAKAAPPKAKAVEPEEPKLAGTQTRRTAEVAVELAGGAGEAVVGLFAEEVVGVAGVEAFSVDAGEAKGTALLRVEGAAAPDGSASLTVFLA